MFPSNLSEAQKCWGPYPHVCRGNFLNPVFCRPFVLIRNSAPSAHFLLYLLCSDLYDGYFLLPRHILKAFCFCLTRGPVHRPCQLFLHSTFCFLLLGSLCRSSPIAASFLERAFLYLVCILASSKAQLLECAGWCREVSRLYRPVFILAKALEKRNVPPMPAFYRFSV